MFFKKKLFSIGMIPVLALVISLMVGSYISIVSNITLTNGKDGLTYQRIDAGSFLMGCVAGDSSCDAIEKDQHLEIIDQAFYISTTEVTVKAFRTFVKSTGYLPESVKTQKGRVYNDVLNWQWVNGVHWEYPTEKKVKVQDDFPVTQVSYNDAICYCKWAGGRLPTEKEWEFAARGGLENAKYPWGTLWPPVKQNVSLVNGSDMRTHDLFPSMEFIADYDDGFASIAPVASFPPNGFGLYDMAGNVWEWTDTRFFKGYSESIIDSVFLKHDVRIVKGGAWCYYPSQLRCSERGYFEKDKLWTGSLGFRCVLEGN
ncbi:MAG: SUMF1/EgtB/PvdO family nonheme iron enzyme [Chryseolinea sp.]